MVVALGLNDRERVEHFLNREPCCNGFVISDLDHGNFDPDFVRIYEEMEGQELISVLLIFKDKIVYYSPDDRPVACYIEYVRQSDAPKLVGKKALIEKFIPVLDIKGCSDCYVREMRTVPNVVNHVDVNFAVKKMGTRDEAARLYDLFMQVRSCTCFTPAHRRVLSING